MLPPLPAARIRRAKTEAVRNAPVRFRSCSYGFCPNRRAQDAIAENHHFTTKRYEWVVEADIETCFDMIDHTALMDRLRVRIGDKRVLALVKAFLKPGCSPRWVRRREQSLAPRRAGSCPPCWPTSPCRFWMTSSLAAGTNRWRLICEIADDVGGVTVSRIKGWDPTWTSDDSALGVCWAQAAEALGATEQARAIRLPASDASRWRLLGVPALFRSTADLVGRDRRLRRGGRGAAHRGTLRRDRGRIPHRRRFRVTMVGNRVGHRGPVVVKQERKASRRGPHC